MKIQNHPGPNRVPAVSAVLACLLAAPVHAAVTPYCWMRGESGILADSSGLNHPFNASFSAGCEPGVGGGGLNAAVTTPDAAGGPLGVTTQLSTVASRWGGFNCSNGGSWIQGPGNTVPDATLWKLPATNWVMECWMLPEGSGSVRDRDGSQFMSTGSGQFGGTPGGAALRLTRTRDELGADIITVRADAIGPLAENNFTIGDPAVISTTRWTHLAVVNDAGVTTFYVNGVASGAPSSLVTPPSGVPYVGSGQDTSASYKGYLDELRYSTFAAGAFTLADLLLIPPGPGFISKPQSAAVWEGGAAPFETVTTLDPANSFVWKRNNVDIPGAILPDYILPVVAAADSGSVFKVAVTNGAVTSTTPDAILTVTPVQTANNAFYRAAVEGEASLAAYFPVDGSTGSTVANTEDGTRNGTLGGSAYYDGRTNRSYGQRALRLRGGGYATVPANPAYEFSDGTGTVEALVYLERPAAQHAKTLFSLAADSSSNYYALQVSADGNTFIYRNDGGVTATWAVTPSLLNRLAHVAVVFTAGKVTAYVDGVSLGQKDNPNFGLSTGLPANIGCLGLDGSGAPVEPWNGSIDELAIYGDALSDNALAVHNSRFIYGTAVTPPTISSSPSGTWNLLSGGVPIFRVTAAGTAPLSYEWKRNGVLVPGNPSATTSVFSLRNSTVASSGTYTVTVTNPQGSVTSDPFTVNYTNPAPADIYAGYVLADGPTGYWRLNETDPGSILLKDYAGGHDGTYNLSRVTRGEAGPYGIDPDKATRFSGNGVGASVPYTPTLNPTGAFSLEFWAKPSASGNIGRAVLGTQNRNVGRTGYAVYQGFNGNWWEAHLGFNGTVLFLQGTTQPAAGRWDHVVVTWNGGTGGANVSNLYVNGRLEDTDSSGPFQGNTVQPLEIGSRFNGTVPYTGTVDEVAFYNFALSPAQVEQHFSIAYYASSVTTNPAPVPAGPEAGTITLAAVVAGFPNTYQWTRNGAPLDPAALNPDGSLKYPQGVTSQTLQISQGLPGDGGQYQLLITNPLGNSSTTPVTVTVALDTVQPTVTYVTASPTLNRVRVGFSKPMEGTSLTNAPAADFTFTGGLTATGVTLTTDPSVIDITTTGMVAGGNYSLTITGVNDTRISQNVVAANSNAFSAFRLTPGVLAWDYYRGIPGSGLGQLQADGQYPDGVWTHRFLAGFTTSSLTIGNNLSNHPQFAGGLGDNYGARVYGWLTPAVSGNYNFFLRSDDASELFISSDSSPGNVSQIAFESGCCDGFKEPGTGDETSGLIPLVAGQSYYIEALYKEGGGGDYVEVAWRKDDDATPANTLRPIPAAFLSSYAPVLGTLSQPVISGNQATLAWSGPGTLQSSPDLITWTDVAGYPSSPYTAALPAGTKWFYRLRQ